MRNRFAHGVRCSAASFNKSVRECLNHQSPKQPIPGVFAFGVTSSVTIGSDITQSCLRAGVVCWNDKEASRIGRMTRIGRI